MIVKLKKREVLGLYFVISKFNEEEDFNKWFSFAIAFSEEKLQPIVTGILKVSKPSKEYDEYEQKRNEFILKYGERDENDKLIMVDNNVKIKDENVEIFKEEMRKLDDDNKDIIDIRIKDLQDYNNLLDTEIEVDIEQVDFKYFPEKISKRDLKILKPLIKVEN